ncbi:hypothetical protein [Streptomyces sp. XH2]|uniref:hypothetical protein n=1 Tax=Streptomyces sp. XH2 TaxID=3412483 RepID=UPI003C7E4EE1
MTLWTCDECTTKYAVGLFRCPRCHSTAFHEEGSMPKIARHVGATNAGAASAPEPPEAAPATEPAVTAPDPDAAPLPEEDTACPGTSSSTSTPTPLMTSEPSASGRGKRARKTASRSAKDPMESSSVPSTDGDPTGPTSEPDETSDDDTN